MELTRKSPFRGGLSSRTGVVALATLAAVIAAVLVLVALNSARNEGAGVTPKVLVADRLIPQGSSGQAIAEGRLYRTAQISEGALVAGAVTDVARLRGTVATEDIYPGQQISATSFKSAEGALTARLAADQRAISIPLDTAHGMIGDVQAGDRVDVLGGFNSESSAGSTEAVLTVLDRNVLVLRAPGEADGGRSGNATEEVTLRVGDTKAPELAFAADNGKLWIVLRPSAGAADSRVGTVSLQSLLAGVSAQPSGR